MACELQGRRFAASMRLCTQAFTACAVVLVVACLLGLVACKDSRAIKNIEHDQNAEQVDHEAGENLQVVSENGRITDEDTGLYVVAVAEDPALPVNVVYVSAEPESTLPVARFTYDASSSNSTEASEPISIASADQPQEQDEQQDQDDRTDSEPQDDSGDNQGDNPQGGDSSDGDSGKSDGDSSGKGSSGSGSGEKGDEEEQREIYDTTGDKPEIPDVDTVAAYGPIAAIVQMLGGSDESGGSTPLVAADDELMASKFKDVFSDEGVDNVNSKGWTRQSSGRTYKADVSQLVAAKPDTVLVFDKAEFSDSQRKKLKKRKISITVVPKLESDTGIVRAAEVVSKMLDKSTGGLSVKRYEKYKKAHDDLIGGIENANGGYGAYEGNVVYDASIPNSSVKRYSSSKYTLVINDWDYGAEYRYKGLVSDAGAGVGIATVGYRTSPVSYYLGVAGVVNTAAAIDTGKDNAGKLAPAWQFNPTELSPSDISSTLSGFSSRLYKNWGTGVTKTTLAVPNGKAFSPDSKGFGSKEFPAVIVADGKMKKSIQKSAKAATGLYHDFGGLISDGTLYTAVETDLSDQSQLDKRVKVNPHGLFSSWIEGSAESFLESAWASAVVTEFDSVWDGSAEDEVKRFYKEQYRYDEITDEEVGTVLAGLDG